MKNKIWQKNIWRRAQLIIIQVGMTFWNLCVIGFSASSFFRKNLLVGLIIVKSCNIIIERILEPLIEDSLLINAIHSAQGVTEGITTFGAEEFLKFLQAIYVDLGNYLYLY